MIEFELDGAPVAVPDRGDTLLGALRDDLGVRTAKDGCSPQGQCGCCTVWVDGAARVACVTPVTRVAGRRVTTLDGLPDADRWATAFTATGASQCGFCTPGIIMRLAAMGPAELTEAHAVKRALLAHLCRCTGWNTIVESAALVGSGEVDDVDTMALEARRVAAEARAALEAGTPQQVGAAVALGAGGFAADTAPQGTPVAVRTSDGEWCVAPTVHEARVAAGKVQGRRTTAPVSWPVDLPEVEDAAVSLQTTWVEPAYLEPDASWCAPGATPASSLANGGAFGGKTAGTAESVAAAFADQLSSPVRVQWSREDVVRTTPKRPPLALALRADGTGIVRLARPVDGSVVGTAADAAPHAGAEAEIRRTIAAVAPLVDVEFVDVDGLTASSALRAAGWAEVAAAISLLGDGPDRITAPNGAVATAEIRTEPTGVLRSEPEGERIVVHVRCGDPLDATVLRSYCIGAAHMALGWVRSEFIAVDSDGEPHDLTIRSFGILRAVDMPPVDVVIEPDSSGPPVCGSDAVFAAVAAAAWRRSGLVSARWPLQSGR